MNTLFLFQVIVSVSGCNDDMCDEAEMCMGLVPIDSDLDVKQTHPMADKLPNAPIPKPSPNQSYNESFGAPNMHNLQICPPGPVSGYPHPNNGGGYPYPNNSSTHGSKSNLAGSFESNLSSQANQNVSMPMPSFPQLHQGTNLPYGFAHIQSPYPSVPQSPPPPYSMTGGSAAPSAPPATPL